MSVELFTRKPARAIQQQAERDRFAAVSPTHGNGASAQTPFRRMLSPRSPAARQRKRGHSEQPVSASVKSTEPECFSLNRTPDYPSGGCSPASTNTLRRLTRADRFNCKASTVARPIAVRPRIRVPSFVQAK